MSLGGSRSSMVTGEAQWLLSAEEYAALPTYKKTTLVVETTERYKATGLVQTIGMRLKLPQTTIATAQVLLHRFYTRETFKSFPITDLAPAVIFLAAKIEEHPRKLKDVLHATNNDPGGEPPQIEEGGGRNRAGERLLALERILLQTICFDLTITHPYSFVFRFVRALKDVPDELVQAAWIVVNDSFRTALCIRYGPRSIAAAALCYAAEKRGICLESLAGSAITDITVFDCPRIEINAILTTISDLYNGSCNVVNNPITDNDNTGTITKGDTLEEQI